MFWLRFEAGRRLKGRQLFCFPPQKYFPLEPTLLRLTLTLLLTSQIANSFRSPLSQVTICIIFSLLKPPLKVLISFVKGNIHICFSLFNIRSLRNSYINHCLFKYVQPSNSHLMFFFLISLYCTFYALCFIYFFFVFCVFH